VYGDAVSRCAGTKELNRKVREGIAKGRRESDAAQLCALGGISLRTLRLNAFAGVERRAIANFEIEFHFL
jgi:hypothetical protein